VLTPETIRDGILPGLKFLQVDAGLLDASSKKLLNSMISDIQTVLNTSNSKGKDKEKEKDTNTENTPHAVGIVEKGSEKDKEIASKSSTSAKNEESGEGSESVEEVKEKVTNLFNRFKKTTVFKSGWGLGKQDNNQN
jgi:DNA-binding ferritin-like protein